MALTYTDPAFIQRIADFIADTETNPEFPDLHWDNDYLTFGDANPGPTFDTQHEVFTSSIMDAASQNATGDNSNGLENPLTLQPSLNYTYTTGYSTSHEQSKAVTVGFEQSFNYKFLGAGGSTTLSASGTFSWTDGTSEDKTTSVSEGGVFPFDVPRFKIYEEKLLFDQQNVSVPYSSGVRISGYVNVLAPDGSTYDSNAVADDLYGYVVQSSIPFPSFPGFDPSSVSYNLTSRSSADYFQVTLTGNLSVQGAGNVNVKIYDITNGSSQVVAAEYDPSVPVGVHRTMDDSGRSFLDSPFDDYVDGGRGDDRITLRSGEDIAHAGDGDDRINANGVGRSLLDGGAGDDRIDLVSTAGYSTILGGDGDDRITVDAPASLIYGGKGDDRINLHGASAGGTVVIDAEGDNRLQVDTDVPLGFERIRGSDNLYVLLGGGETYDRTRDVVWVDFFANPDHSDNRINGLGAEQIERLATTPGLPGQATITLTVSEDAWLGDAQFTIQVDGATVGGPRMAFASHAAGETQSFDVQADLGPGSHQVGVTFLNDAWGGTPDTDRNLYLDGVAFNGAAFLEQPVTLWSNGSAAVSVDAARGGQSLGAGLTVAASSADLGQLAGLAGSVAS